MRIRILKRTLLLIAISFPILLNAQTASLKANWQNLDLKTDSVFGVSTEKAYTELLKGKKHVTVLVAVIDVGVDINHEDLKSVIWTNPKEIAGNHIDDDKNGYVDDLHGWNFLGGPKGNVEHETYEYVRLIRLEKPKYENADSTKLSAAELVKYHEYLEMKTKLNTQLAEANISRPGLVGLQLDTLLMDMKNKNPKVADFKNFKPKNDFQKNEVNYAINHYKGNDSNYTSDYRKYLVVWRKDIQNELDYSLNINYDPRSIVGDNYNDDNEHYYGNNDVTGPDAHHGTHVAGIIGAVRDNNIGIKGVANDVMIMPVRVTFIGGDERDKDVANAIRYAADNGAKVINMSFGKDYSWDKKVVDDAVKYAVSKDVLIVHAAGNENADRDKKTFYPNKIYADSSGMASAWIEVGASGSKDGEFLKAYFSSYGKINVDVFAPGVDIYSTTPNSTYGDDSGTSMATPMVAGLAALIRSYYPKLTAVQVKEIILNSVVKVNHDVTINEKKVPFADICKTGGIINAYNALKLAATY